MWGLDLSQNLAFKLLQRRNSGALARNNKENSSFLFPPSEDLSCNLPTLVSSPLCLDFSTGGLNSALKTSWIRRFPFSFNSVLQGTLSSNKAKVLLKANCLNCTQVIIISLTVAIALVIRVHTKKRCLKFFNSILKCKSAFLLKISGSSPTTHLNANC